MGPRRWALGFGLLTLLACREEASAPPAPVPLHAPEACRSPELGLAARLACSGAGAGFVAAFLRESGPSLTAEGRRRLETLAPLLPPAHASPAFARTARESLERLLREETEAMYAFPEDAAYQRRQLRRWDDFTERGHRALASLIRADTRIRLGVADGLVDFVRAVPFMKRARSAAVARGIGETLGHALGRLTASLGLGPEARTELMVGRLLPGPEAP